MLTHTRRPGATIFLGCESIRRRIASPAGPEQLRRMRVIDMKRRFVFVHIPKTGGTSFVISMYSDKRGRSHAPFRAHERGILRYMFQRNGAVLTALEFRAILKDHLKEVVLNRSFPTNLDGFKSFSIVRNPWDRTVSWYKNVISDERHRRHLHVDPSIDFPTFVRQYLHVHYALRPQTYWLRSWSGEIGVDRIFRLEDGPRIWKEISEYIGVHLLEHHENVARDRRGYQGFYDGETKAVVASAYAEEIEFFDYKFS